ncbi:hypothetical protein K492DRAFT_234267 [Lichtheimia hyalospora FSU 10163]|nr:hypothetical protein K492DRAFT_234267 [Lichtheimia hyalospora FSU 10163]
MSSVFVSDNGAFTQSQPPKAPEPARPKRPRPSLACIRCRKKKVKCDFVQPTCGRCANAGLPCSYATPPRRVNGQAFDELGTHVEELKERMQRMQSELAMIKSNLHPFSGGSYGAGGASNGAATAATADGINSAMSSEDDPHKNISPSPMMVNQLSVAHDKGGGALSMADPLSQQPVTWKLSLSPSGLRIDTNIASVADLYRILLNGISQLNISSESTTNLFSTDSIRGDKSRPHKAWGRYGQRVKPLEDVNAASSSSSHSNSNNNMGGIAASSSNHASNSNSGGGRLWEVDDNEARKIIQERQVGMDDTIPKETLDNLMNTCYHHCFLAYQIVDKEAFMQEYTSGNGLDPLLANSISAWVSKHGCVYHNACPGRNPSTMGEAYFKNARQLLKKCFDISNATTVHALLNLYMYQLSSERSSLAYLYIGLAIRMAQDLKFHKKEHMPAEPKQRETSKRLWWSAYWLDLCAALESNRPTMVDDKDCDLEYPTKLDFEDDETGFRIDFCVHSIKLMKIRKDIMKHLPSEQSGQSLLSAISRLENALTNWLNELPQHLRFEAEDVFQKTGTFRDEAMLILNIQYQTTWIMLHKFFLPKQNQTATPVALLSLNICTKSANFITKMLDIYANNLCWCQFFYTLDGVIASVSIHQSNALSEEKDVALLAQRNLILTAEVLRKSPLVYMEKVNEIIESIESFLKQNNLPTDISNMPAVNEDLVNQQSIYSVFHPGVFDNNRSDVKSAATGTSATGAMKQTPTVSHASPVVSSQQQQQQTSASMPVRTPVVPSANLTPHMQQQAAMSTSPSPSPQPSMSSQGHPQQQPANVPSQQQQPLAGSPMGFANQPLHGPGSTNMMSGPGMLFTNPALMGFPGVGTGQVDQMLFRDMNFAVDQSAAVGEEALAQPDVFGSLGSNMLGGNGNNPAAAAGYSTNATSAGTTAPFTFSADLTPDLYNASQLRGDNNLFSNPETMFGLTGQHQQHPQQQQQQHQQQQYGDASGFDPANFFGMDQAAMNALLYGSGNAGNNGPGGQGAMPMGFSQQQPSSDSFAAASMYAAAASNRKRTHRDWEEPS